MEFDWFHNYNMLTNHSNLAIPDIALYDARTFDTFYAWLNEGYGRKCNTCPKINVPQISFDASIYKCKKENPKLLQTHNTISFLVLIQSLTSKGPHYNFAEIFIHFKKEEINFKKQNV